MNTLQKLAIAIANANPVQVSKLCQKYLSERTLTYVTHEKINYKVFGYLNQDQELIVHWDFYPHLGYASVYISTKEIEIKDRRFSSLKNATAFVQRTLKSYGYILVHEEHDESSR